LRYHYGEAILTIIYWLLIVIIDDNSPFITKALKVLKSMRRKTMRTLVGSFFSISVPLQHLKAVA